LDCSSIYDKACLEVMPWDSFHLQAIETVEMVTIISSEFATYIEDMKFDVYNLVAICMVLSVILAWSAVVFQSFVVV
jgi:hypothetical protein